MTFTCLSAATRQCPCQSPAESGMWRVSCRIEARARRSRAPRARGCAEERFRTSVERPSHHPFTVQYHHVAAPILRVRAFAAAPSGGYRLSSSVAEIVPVTMTVMAVAPFKKLHIWAFVRVNHGQRSTPLGRRAIQGLV